MTDVFSKAVRDFSEKTKQRIDAVFRSSAQDVAEEMVTPIYKGGNMRVKTGFLRASLRASTEAMPSIDPNARPKVDAKLGSYPESTDQINLVIAGVNLDQTIFLGFTASYARPREYRDGFVRLAAQRWETIVDANIEKAIKAFP